ncbi:MAG: hypothetical protein ACXACU_16480, partial [Candidatus Hodarchaeales archaeon]
MIMIRKFAAIIPSKTKTIAKINKLTFNKNLIIQFLAFFGTPFWYMNRQPFDVLYCSKRLNL